jgi:hypothetical protein
MKIIAKTQTGKRFAKAQKGRSLTTDAEAKEDREEELGGL